MTADPAEVSCADPTTQGLFIKMEFWQRAGVESQKVTRPVVTVEPFEIEAVRVTTVPVVTEELGDRVNVVVVGVWACD